MKINTFYTIEQYITEIRKKDTIWMVFNTRYNEIHRLDLNSNEEEPFYNKAFTDNQAREDFLEYMKAQFPKTTCVKVFDLVSVGWIEWPYLGSMAIDADIDSDVYNALCQKYGNPNDISQKTSQTLWIMTYEDSKVLHQKKCLFFDDPTLIC